MKALIRPPVKYHGGKYYLCRWIIEQFPQHETYIEPFGGAASVLLNKPRSQREIYNDAEYSIFNLMIMLRDESRQVIDLLKTIKYTKEEYLKLKEIYKSNDFNDLDPLTQAKVTYAVRRMSRGGLCGTFCWSSRIYCGMPGEEHGWITSIEQLPLVCERLKDVEIYNEPAVEILKKHDSEKALFYLDPPYPKETRVFKTGYLLEMNKKDHVDLATAANQIKGQFIISSYPSDLYDQLFANCQKIFKEIPNHSSHEKVKEQKRECLWIKTSASH